MAKRALIADQLHIKSKNFASLIEYLDLAEYEVATISHPAKLLAAFGDYSDMEEVWPYVEQLVDQGPDQVFGLTVAGESCFSLCKAEMLCKLAPTEFWIARGQYGRTERELFDIVWSHDRDVLLQNIAAVQFWYDRWRNILQEQPVFDFAFLFSGSLIYARVFSLLMKRRQGMLYICESFFTGKDYYLEARHSPLPNNSALKSNGIYKNISVPLEGAARRGVRAGLYRGLAEMANKNVRQPDATGERLFSADQKVVVIFGQVLNDFSLLNYGETGFHSIGFYFECIERILAETDASVVFKAHPWEQKKAHIRTSLTKDYLVERFGTQDRVKIVEDYPISDLIDEADFVIGINSQSLIEAALGGIKPLQCGNAFYGKKGFTHDINSVDEIVGLINASNGSYLSIDEFFELETFLLRALDVWLIPESPALGVARLEARLGALKKSRAKAASPNIVTTAKPSVTPGSDIVVPAGIMPLEKKPGSSATRRKLRKLRSNPKAFFRDAKNPLVRSLARLF